MSERDSPPDDIEVTEEMVEAGDEALTGYFMRVARGEDIPLAVRAVYIAMEKARRGYFTNWHSKLRDVPRP